MVDPTPEEIARRYTRRAFSVLRVAGGLADSADADVRRLGRRIQAAIAEYELASIGRRDLAGLLRSLESMIAAAYVSTGSAQVAAVREVLGIEAAWAAGVINGSPAAESVVDRWMREMLVLGATPAQQWERQGGALARRVGDIVRDAAATSQPAEAVREAIREAIAIARRDAQSLADVSTTSAAAQGHAEDARANGAVAFRLHAVLDSRVTVGCALRHGLMYTLDYQPLGHSIPIERPPPRHWACRSVLYPLLRMPRPTDRPVGTFEQFIDSLSAEEQADILGAGRAALWRRGVITKADLVNQRGRVLTLGELRARRD